MVKSMFAGVAGLRAHQSKMDVIGNNIANVNTWGYKSANMSFKDAMYQSTSSGSAGDTKDGGYGAVNANQVGYGVTTGSITYDFGTGGMSPSAKGTDCMIDGTGFFIVGPMKNGGSVSLNGDDAIKASGLFLSRVGKFDVDPQGYLVDDGGNYVYGFKRTGSLSDAVNFDTQTLVPLRLPTSAQMADLDKKQSSNQVEVATKLLEEARADYNKANIELGTARQEYFYKLDEYNKAFDSATLKNLVKLRDDAKTVMDKAYVEWTNKKDIDTGNSLRNAYITAKLDYDEKYHDVVRAEAALKAPKANNSNPSDAALDEYVLAYKELRDAPSTISEADYKTLQTKLAEKETALKNLQTSLSVVEEDSPEATRDKAALAVKAAEAKLDAANKAVANAESVLQTAKDTQSNTEGKKSSGSDEVASFSNYKIQVDGTIVGTSESGITVPFGKIALGSVPNTGGLEKESGYYYSIGASAGNVNVFEAGGAQGKIRGNYLEMAKVDLATEMTDMITTQRGFQANSKIITVTDQMLEELVNIKR
jgi:flagellar hook protein FlgE